MITEDPKVSKMQPLTTSVTVNKPSADTVDLTLDSDDEDDATKKSKAATAAAAKSKTNGM